MIGFSCIRPIGRGNNSPQVDRCAGPKLLDFSEVRPAIAGRLAVMPSLYGVLK